MAWIIPLLPLIWTTIGAAALAYVCRYIAARINATKLGAATQWDDLLVGWARDAVSNVGTKVADKVKVAFADGKIDEAEYRDILESCRTEAIAQIRLLAKMAGQEAKLDDAVLSGALDLLIRKAVDDRQRAIGYENKIIAREQSEHAAREADYAKEHPEERKGT